MVLLLVIGFNILLAYGSASAPTVRDYFFNLNIQWIQSLVMRL